MKDDKKEMENYKKLIETFRMVKNFNGNFSCSYISSILTRIKNNVHFNTDDFTFDVDSKIKELNEYSKELFLTSKYTSFVAIDLEVSGLDPEIDKIIKISAVKVKNGCFVDEFVTLVNPKIKIDEDICILNKISNEDVSSAKELKEIFPEFVNFINNDPIVIHFAEFDMNFIKNRYYDIFKRDFPFSKLICTKMLLKFLHDEYFNKKCDALTMEYVKENLFNIYDLKEENQNPAFITAKIFMKISDKNTDLLIDENNY